MEISIWIIIRDYWGSDTVSSCHIYWLNGDRKSFALGVPWDILAFTFVPTGRLAAPPSFLTLVTLEASFFAPPVFPIETFLSEAIAFPIPFFITFVTRDLIFFDPPVCPVDTAFSGTGLVRTGFTARVPFFGSVFIILVLVSYVFLFYSLLWKVNCFYFIDQMINTQITINKTQKKWLIRII